MSDLPLCPLYEYRLCPSACHRVTPDKHCWHQGNDNERITDLERTFDLRWRADIRAIARWRSAAPGRDLTLPDHADLCVWLLEEIASLDRINTNLRALLANEWTLSEEDSRKFVDAILNASEPNDALKDAAKRYIEHRG